MRSTTGQTRATVRATARATGLAVTARTLMTMMIALALAAAACERSDRQPALAPPDARARARAQAVAAPGLDGVPEDAAIVLRIDGAALRSTALAASPAALALGESCAGALSRVDVAVLSINEAQQRAWSIRGALADPSFDPCARGIARALGLPYERAQGALWFGSDERRAALRSAAQGALVRSAEVREAMTLAASATVALVIDGPRARWASDDPRWARLGLDPVAVRAQWSAVRWASLSLVARDDRATIHAEVTVGDERGVEPLRALFEPMRPRLAATLRAIDSDPARALAPRVASNLHWIDTARSMRATLALDGAGAAALAQLAAAP